MHPPQSLADIYPLGTIIVRAYEENNVKFTCDTFWFRRAKATAQSKKKSRRPRLSNSQVRRAAQLWRRGVPQCQDSHATRAAILHRKPFTVESERWSERIRSLARTCLRKTRGDNMLKLSAMYTTGLRCVGYECFATSRYSDR